MVGECPPGLEPFWGCRGGAQEVGARAPRPWPEGWLVVGISQAK